MAEPIIDLNKLKEQLGLNSEQAKILHNELDKATEKANRLGDSSGRVKTLADSFGAVKNSIMETNAAAGMLIANIAKANDVKLTGVTAAFSGLTQAILGSNNSAGAYAGMMTSLGGVIGQLSPTLAKLFTTIAVDLPTAFDVLTGTTREFKKDTIDLGNVYGLSYDQIARKTLDYQKAVLFANSYTFEGIEAVRTAAESAANYGVTVDDLTRTFSIAGVQQNFLSEGFLLSSETGLKSSDVMAKMADATRKMGYSVEDAGKPLVAMENIARATGLPISEIGNRVFETAKQFSRLGLTVDGMEPIIRRFTDVLGPSFKGLAIEETTRLFDNLKSKVNTTEAAFIAMRGGLAGPGAGVAEAQLAFEDAFKNPVEIMKSLSTTLGGVAGGRIIKFEEARANPELANQFKIQRDLLAQLTGNTDPQSQRTLMAILADLQSGRQLTSAQDKTLQEALKSGQQKQDERASMKDQLDRIAVGLQTQANVTLGNILNRMVPSQVQGELARKAGSALESGVTASTEFMVREASKIGESISSFASGKGFDIGAIGDKISGAVQSQLPGAGLREAPRFGVGVNPFAEPTLTGVPAPARPATPTVAPPPATTPASALSSKETSPPGTKETSHFTFLIKGDDEFTKLIAKHAQVLVRDTNGGK